MYRILCLAAACFTLLGNISFAQEPVRCATVEYSAHKRQSGEPSAREQEMYAAVSASVNRWKNNPAQNRITTTTVIPVIVHVVYNTPAQNISRAQILSQLDVLNQDFGKTNSDTSSIPLAFQPLATNTQIQFCLATRKANGDWTDGIERRQTSVVSYTTSGVDSVKFYAFGGLDAWDYSQYLNIWVINFANGVLGITQMPLAGPGSTDGLCIQYNAFGKGAFPLLTNYNKGRTATHEVGHWLGLFHIWGDDNGWCYGSDSCSDTPNQAAEHYNCPAFPSLDSCSNVSPGTMYMNYMDYSYDRCLLMFTPEQTQRMNAQFTGFRSGLVTSQGCLPPIGIAETELAQFVNLFPNPATDVLHINLGLPVSAAVGFKIFDALGRNVYSSRLSPRTRLALPLTDFPGGIYLVRLEVQGTVVNKRICIRHD